MPTLIVGPNWVGDMMMAHGLIQSIHGNRPDDRIHVMAPAWCLDVARRMPEVSGWIESPFAHGELNLKGRLAFAKTLQAEQYHRAFVLPNSFKSALIPWMARIPRRIGWRGEWRQWLLTECRVLVESRFPMMLDRYAALNYPRNLALSALQLPVATPYPQLVVDADHQAALQSQFGLDPSRLVVICPGAEYGPAKVWPMQHHAVIAHRLLVDGYQVALLGSANDRDAGLAITAGIPEVYRSNLSNLIGQTRLLDAIDLIGMSRAVLTHDSGLMHIAAAVGRPLVALYGPSSMTETPPLSEHAVTLTHAVPCQPCFQRVCPLEHQACLAELSVDVVMEAMNCALRLAD